mmetsp:Transcript_58725/g.80114  ORF Transcript_58725/g.80114 Transcript_58725/m.80114 type:complete len:97 (+) Transcript_58725:294-584(+)
MPTCGMPMQYPFMAKPLSLGVLPPNELDAQSIAATRKVEIFMKAPRPTAKYVCCLECRTSHRSAKVCREVLGHKAKSWRELEGAPPAGGKPFGVPG